MITKVAKLAVAVAIMAPLFACSAHGTEIIVDQKAKTLMVVDDKYIAIYPIAVGRPGAQWKGTMHISAKKMWPDWHPTTSMRKRKPGLPDNVPGGMHNPLGARALYLGSSLYRIHGTNEPNSIGRAVSSGCIRMRNDDVIDLYERVPIGTKVTIK